MQTVDSESQLPAACTDRKTDSDPDYPPESFWLSKDAEFDWFDRNAFLNRNDSTKGTLNSTNLSSQRYLVNLKAAIIGLPRTRKTTYVDSKRRQCKPVNVRLFPMRSYSIDKAPATVAVAEPSSPKVSCIGRVRSKKCPSRRKPTGQPIEPVKSVSQRSGLLSRISSLFRSERRQRRNTGKWSAEKFQIPPEISDPRKICVTVKPVSSEPATPSGPPALGSMIRFASGHRSESLGDSEEYDVARCYSLDSGLRGV